MKKKVLVIGGSGFIGSNLCRYLSKHMFDVYSFDLYIPDKTIDKVTYVKGDFFNDTILHDAVRGKDYIIHALSTINPGNSNDKYMQGYERDFIQTVKLCEMVIGEKSRMLFISSGGTIYGDAVNQPISEECLPKPINHYANLKLCIENTICTFIRQANADMVIARISNAYGPGQDYTRGVGFIDSALKRTLAGQPIEIWGEGNNIRDYIYIEDICKILEVLLNYRGSEIIFNVSSGKGASQNDIIHILDKMNLKNEVTYKEARSVDLKSVIIDNSKIKQLIDFKLTDLEDGIAMYYQWLKNNQDIM